MTSVTGPGLAGAWLAGAWLAGVDRLAEPSL